MGARTEHASAPGSTAVFRAWRICLSQAQAESGTATRRSKLRAKLAGRQNFEKTGCNFSNTFCSTGQAHGYFSPGWQHLQAWPGKRKVTAKFMLHSGIGTGGAMVAVGFSL